MNHNITPPQAQAGQPCGLSASPCSAQSVGIGLELLDAEENTETLRATAARLWDLLDGIDTASDAFKPTTLADYQRFYAFVMRKADERHKCLVSDGTNLFLPNKADMPTCSK